MGSAFRGKCWLLTGSVAGALTGVSNIYHTRLTTDGGQWSGGKMAADRVSPGLCGIECHPSEWGATTPSVVVTLSLTIQCVTHHISGGQSLPHNGGASGAPLSRPAERLISPPLTHTHTHTHTPHDGTSLRLSHMEWLDSFSINDINKKSNHMNSSFSLLV